MSSGSSRSEGMLDALIDESRKQADTLSAMRKALENGDYEQALEEAKALAGLKPLKGKAATHQ